MSAVDYDVIVVGAGFGGPVAAKRCAEAGLSTLILERASTPGQKVISSCTIPFYGFLFGPQWIRDGDPPIERPITGIRNFFVRDGKVYATDNSFRVPGPLANRLAIGYTVYCRPFCTWLAERAVEAGAELRTSVAAVDVIMESGAVKGVVTDGGEELRCRLLIDAEGVQNILARKAGIRKTYRPEAVELCLLYDFKMAKEDIDRICGYQIEYYWAMPEEKIIAPLGEGSAVYIFPYRESIHMTIGRFLKGEEGVPVLAKELDAYYRRFFQVDRWREMYAPRTELRARIWDTCPIYAGLYRDMRSMPTFGDGVLLIGDAAGLEAAAIADGVPSAWFSAEMAAETAIEALRAGDTGASFLSRYQRRLEEHPLIPALISDTHRRDLAWARRSGDEAEMRRRVNQGWGIRLMGHLALPVLRAVYREMRRDPRVLKNWLDMFNRYHRLYA
ncbi:NAD(P)/FAD-dependent oxidoreductase [Candidatus Solincola tengchongensis]|uniref:NAD(P)/FAD-dependent oxidoreductase n=1 Tax=Candidatus Solincola tengchongensis TaxID=2900693 RepID=UPI00257D5EB2|nr:NAD(P)/FAD-dependent oxidoreductase [Candidatus Solincola tengchongensis]